MSDNKDSKKEEQRPKPNPDANKPKIVMVLNHLTKKEKNR